MLLVTAVYQNKCVDYFPVSSFILIFEVACVAVEPDMNAQSVFQAVQYFIEAAAFDAHFCRKLFSVAGVFLHDMSVYFH